MGKPNAIWRLNSALYSIVKAKELLIQCSQTTDEKIWIKYIFKKHAASVELACIIDDKLSLHAYLAERILDFANKNIKGDENIKESLNTPQKIKQHNKVFDAMYSAILKLLILELKKLKLDYQTIKQNANKILDENDPYFEPVINYFKKLLDTIKT